MASSGMNFGAWQSGFNNLLRSKSAAGIDLFFKDNEEYTINLTILKIGKEGLEIEETNTDLEKISDVSIEPLVPLNLVFNGKGLVHKLVEAEDGTDDGTLLQQVLPNAKLDEFYVDSREAIDGKYMVSILRKDRVDPVLEEFTKLGLYVVSASFGPFALQSVKSLLSDGDSENWSVQVAGHYLEYEGNKIANYQTNSSSNAKLEIGGEHIEEEAIIPFAAAFEFLFKRVDEQPTGALSIITAREEIKQRKLFQVGGLSVLVFFLIGLITNFMLFSSYSDTYRQLESELFLSKDRVAYLLNLEKDVSTKQNLLKELGLLTPARTSFYADAIAASVPKIVKLTGILLNPLRKKVKVGENPLFNSGTITVTGSSKKSTTLNEWVKLLKQMDWVDQVTVVDYQSTGGAGTGDFELNIGIK